MGFLDRAKKAAESASNVTSKVGVGADSGQISLANTAKKLMNEGVDTPGHIDSMSPTGKTDTPGGAENVIAVTVRPAGGAEYQVTINQYVYPSAPFNAGEDVNVRVDPADPNVVMIWGK
jgi:hypothetical protein